MKGPIQFSNEEDLQKNNKKGKKKTQLSSILTC